MTSLSRRCRGYEEKSSRIEKEATWCNAPREVADRSEIVFSIVGYPEDVREVILGEMGVLSQSRAFDGSFGNINLSASLGEFLHQKAPEINRRVEEELLPKWLRQRGIDPEEVTV